MAGEQYDYEGAIAAGVPQSDIVSELKKNSPDFDVEGALKSGISLRDIASEVRRGNPNKTPTTFLGGLEEPWKKYGQELVQNAKETFTQPTPSAKELNEPEWVNKVRALKAGPVTNLAGQAIYGTLTAAAGSTINAAITPTVQKSAGAGMFNEPMYTPDIVTKQAGQKQDVSSFLDKAKQALSPLYQKLPAEVRAIPSTIGAVGQAYLNMAPFGYAAGKGLEAAGKGITKKTIAEEVPRSILQKEAGFTEPEAAANVTETISKNKIAASLAGKKGILKQAQNKIDKQMNKQVELEAALTKSSNVIPVSNTIETISKNVNQGMYPEFLGGTEQEQALTTLNEIKSTLEDNGLGGDQKVSKIPGILRDLNKWKDPFESGSHNIMDDPVKRQIAAKVYFDLNNQLKDIAPELHSVNQNISDLLETKNVINRITKRKNSIGESIKSLAYGGSGAIIGTIIDNVLKHGHEGAAAGVLLGLAHTIPKFATGEKIGPELIRTGQMLQEPWKSMSGKLISEKKEEGYSIPEKYSKYLKKNPGYQKSFEENLRSIFKDAYSNLVKNGGDLTPEQKDRFIRFIYQSDRPMAETMLKLEKIPITDKHRSIILNTSREQADREIERMKKIYNLNHEPKKPPETPGSEPASPIPKSPKGPKPKSGGSYKRPSDILPIRSDIPIPKGKGKGSYEYNVEDIVKKIKGEPPEGYQPDKMKDKFAPILERIKNPKIEKKLSRTSDQEGPVSPGTYTGPGNPPEIPMPGSTSEIPNQLPYKPTIEMGLTPSGAPAPSNLAPIVEKMTGKSEFSNSQIVNDYAEWKKTVYTGDRRAEAKTMAGRQKNQHEAMVILNNPILKKAMDEKIAWLKEQDVTPEQIKEGISRFIEQPTTTFLDQYKHSSIDRNYALEAIKENAMQKAEGKIPSHIYSDEAMPIMKQIVENGGNIVGKPGNYRYMSLEDMEKHQAKYAAEYEKRHPKK
jgi:hypothetical protein